MKRFVRGTLLAALCGFLAHRSLAQDASPTPPPPPPGEAAEVQPPPPTPCPPCPPSPTPTPTPKWTGSLGLGLSITSGNSDTTSFSLSLNAKYTPNLKTLFKAEALHLYGKSDGEKNVDKSYALARYEYSLSKQLFAFGEVVYLRDDFKNVDYLISPLVGAGYRLIQTDRVTFAADASIGGAFEKNPGAGSNASGAFGIGENFQWKISPVATLTERAGGLWKTNDLEDFNVHFEVGIAASVTKKSELKAAYLLDYKNQPVGEGIAKTDSTIVLAFVLKL